MGNLTQQKMQEYLGPRIWDRLMEGGSPVLALDWESYRSKKK
jgi:DNA replication protein DnaC